MRLPASTVKLGEKLERYHTAVQVGAGAEGSFRGVRAPARVEGTVYELQSHFSATHISDLQRSESVRSLGSSRTEVLVTPAGVASKRNLFEKELAGQNRTEPTSIRKVRTRSQLLGCRPMNSLKSLKPGPSPRQDKELYFSVNADRTLI